jgi:hypothetical protein
MGKGCRVAKVSLFASLVLLITAGCDSALVTEAREAERDQRVISNDLMLAAYPEAFRKGAPEYLERDFEAGADLICDQIELKYKRDICAEPEINWR